MLTAPSRRWSADPEEVAIQALEHAYQQGEEAARNGWEHDPRTVPMVRLAAATREAFTRGYDAEIEEMASTDLEAREE